MVAIISHNDSNYSLISIASYEVITGYQEVADKPPTGLYFNKIMSLLQEGLKEKDINFGLPHCWYRWGDEVVRYLMPRSIEWNHDEPQFTKVSWHGGIPKGRGYDPLSKIIIEMVENLTEKYAYEDGIERAVAEVYKHAPFEFQRKYRFCREAFGNKFHTGIDLQNYGNQFLWPSVQEALSLFPKEDFPNVAVQIEPFKDIMKILLCGDEVDYRYANEVSEEFWTWFCYYLRLHPNCHENVPNTTLNHWEEKIPWENERYIRLLGDHASRLEKMERGRLSPRLLSIASNRNTEIQQENELFDSFEKDMDGFEDFIKKSRESYQSK